MTSNPPTASNPPTVPNPPTDPAPPTRAERLDRLPFTRRHGKVLVGSGIGWALDAMDVGLISFVMVAVARHWDLSTSMTGWIASVGFIGMALGATVGGGIADRVGRRHVFALTLIVYGIATGMSALSVSVGMFLVLRFLVGLGLGAELPVASTLVAEFAPRRIRGRMVVWLEAFWAVGWLAAAVIGATVVPTSPDRGWRWALAIGMVPALYAIIVRLHLPESVRFLESKGRHREAEAVVADFESAAGVLAPTSGVGAPPAGGTASESALVPPTSGEGGPAPVGAPVPGGGTVDEGGPAPVGAPAPEGPAVGTDGASSGVGTGDGASSGVDVPFDEGGPTPVDAGPLGGGAGAGERGEPEGESSLETASDVSLSPVTSSVEAATSIWSVQVRRRTVALWVIWFCINLSYYGAFVWIPGLLVAQGFTLVKSFQFTLVITLAQLPGYAAAAWLIERWGRRMTLGVFLAGSAVAAGLYGLASGVPMIITAGMLLSFFNLGAWGALYAIGPELYPTRLRGTGTGAAAGFGRLASIGAPLLVPALLGAGGTPLVFGVFALAFALAAAGAFTLPELRGRRLDG